MAPDNEAKILESRARNLETVLEDHKAAYANVGSGEVRADQGIDQALKIGRAKTAIQSRIGALEIRYQEAKLAELTHYVDQGVLEASVLEMYQSPAPQSTETQVIPPVENTQPEVTTVFESPASEETQREQKEEILAPSVVTPEKSEIKVAKKTSRFTRGKSYEVYLPNDSKIITKSSFFKRAIESVASTRNGTSINKVAKTLYGHTEPHDISNLKKILKNPVNKELLTAQGYEIVIKKIGDRTVLQLRQVHPEKPVSKPSESSPKRGYAREAVIDIYTKGTFSIELPTGKKTEVTGGLPGTVAQLISEGVKDASALTIRIYGVDSRKNRSRLNNGIKYLNNAVSAHGVRLVNRQKRNEIAVYEWEAIRKPGEPIDIEIESEVAGNRLSDHETGIFTNLLDRPKVRTAFDAEGIPTIPTSVVQDINKLLDSLPPRVLTNEQMRNFRHNIIDKIRNICAKGLEDEVFEDGSDAVRLLLAYFIELGDQQEEAFKLVLDELEKNVLIVARTDRNLRLVDINYESVPPQPAASKIVPDEKPKRTTTGRGKTTPSSKQSVSDRSGTDSVLAQVRMHEGELRILAIAETLRDIDHADQYEAEMARIKANEAVVENVPELEPKAEINEIPQVAEEATISASEKTPFASLIKRDPDALKHAREVVGQMLTVFPHEPTQAQLTREYHNLTRMHIEQMAEKGVIKKPNSSAQIPKIRYEDVGVLIYMKRYSKAGLNARALDELRDVIGQIVTTVLDKDPNRKNGNRR